MDGENMTHDELLAKIDVELTTNYADECGNFPIGLNALRAVVELHTPTPEGRYPDILCQGCSMTEEVVYVYYPCRTIRAIEKELG